MEEKDKIQKLKEDKMKNEETKESENSKKEIKEKQNETKKEQNIENNKNETVEKTKYVPYTPIVKKGKKENKEKLKVVERPDIEKEFNRIKRKRKKQMIIAIVVIVLILISGIFCTGFALLNINDVRILAGISIRNIEVGGLTKDEATQKLKEVLEIEKTREIELNANGEKSTMTLEQIELEYLIEDAIIRAYEVGRNGNIFQNNFAIMKSLNNKQDINLEIKYNEQLLDDIMKNVGSKLPNAMIDNSYNIEDKELIITRGTAGLTLDIQKSKENIIELAKQGTLIKIDLETKHTECPDIDIDKIYSEIHTEPQNAYYTTNPFQIYPHKDGIDFDVEEAKNIVEKEQKEEYTIKLKITHPEVLTNQIGTEAFPDLLSRFTTKYDSTNISRANNLALAASKINGTVVMPGEIFSYNKTVGKRTVEAGYKEAAGFSGGKVVPMLGGGICQVSSTLYDAVVYANLRIVERYNHMFQVAYVETGKDATVVWGSLDFKFENTRKYPIMLQASARSGLLEIKVYGIKEEVEYDIEIVTKVLSYTPYRVIYETDYSLAPGQEKVAQSGIQGCKSITYKIVKLNGVEKEQIVLSSDSYDPQNKIIKRGPAAQTTTPPETTPPTETTPPAEATPPAQETPTTPPEQTTPDTPTEKPGETPTTPSEQPPAENGGTTTESV